ncbi:MAG: RluA family pseudouridine synthase [Rhodobiaceae bacterium]|nr:RluA family pseudouridine synthase [Rhodobiaceae bacterium]
MSRLITLDVPAESAGDRLDRMLAALIDDLSRTRLRALIEAGEVSVDGRKLMDPSARVNSGQHVEVRVPPPAPATPQPQDIPLNVLFEDDSLIVIDKPAGLTVHPGAGSPDGTLVNALLHHCGKSLSGIGGVERPGIVHRLDKETSGVMVVAKTDRAHRDLAAQFADHGRTRGLKRAYRALVWGAPAPSAGAIDKPIGRDPRNALKMAIRRDGREAVTHYVTEERFGSPDAPVAAEVTCRLETGRTHQIRVHMAAIGHPLLADPVYAAGFATKSALLDDLARTALAALGRQALHAYLLEFEHPLTGEAMHFESPLPPDYSHLKNALAAM